MQVASVSLTLSLTLTLTLSLTRSLTLPLISLMQVASLERDVERAQAEYDELLQALQARVGRPLRPHEAQAPTSPRNPAPTRNPDPNPAPPHSELMP